MTEGRARMIGGHVTVELATEMHLGELVRLWRAARAESGVSRDALDRPGQEDRVRAALLRPDVRILVARSGPDAVGFLSMASHPSTGLSDMGGVWIDMLFVDGDARKRGVARALLAAAARSPEATNADQIAILAPAQARDTNRFLARLGFTFRLTLRTTQPEALRRRLAPDEDSQREKLLQRRRVLVRARKRLIAPEDSEVAPELA